MCFTVLQYLVGLNYVVQNVRVRIFIFDIKNALDLESNLFVCTFIIIYILMISSLAMYIDFETSLIRVNEKPTSQAMLLFKVINEIDLKYFFKIILSNVNT